MSDIDIWDVNKKTLAMYFNHDNTTFPHRYSNFQTSRKKGQYDNLIKYHEYEVLHLAHSFL
jgi:hypothetical protein